MLAIVSDLHLQHTADDGIRFRRNGELREIGVARNVGAGAIERFFEMTRERTLRHAAHELELIFAGDVFELHRSPIWFYGGSDVRPWRSPDPTGTTWGADDDTNPLRRTLMRVLEAVERENAEVWNAIARFAGQCREDGIALTVHFIPGNHDRLVNAWPSARRRVRKLLGVEPADDSLFPYVLTWPRHTGYGVLVRHGHEYDADNFPCPVAKGQALNLAPEDYLRPAFGDYISLEVAARLAAALRAYCATELRSEHGDDFRELYFALTEFDDVRPQSLLKKYLRNRRAKEDRAIKRVQVLLEDISAAAKADPFFRRGVPWPARIAARVLSPWMISKLARLWLFDDAPPPAPAMIAQYEPELIKGEVDLVVAGHTHVAHQAPLPPAVAHDDRPFFIDSGTWRTIIHGLDFRRASPWWTILRTTLLRRDPLPDLLRELDPRPRTCFSPIRAYTMIFCYSEDERDAQNADGRRLEVSSGHLAPVQMRSRTPARAGDEPYLGRYDITLAKRKTLPPPMKLTFTRLTVNAVPELWAELRLEFGADDQSRVFEARRVRRGSTFDLTAAVPPLKLDPELDGELWVHGVEKNLIWNKLLPWAIDRLPRDSAGGFVAREGELLIRGFGKTDMVLGYRVEEDKE